MTIDLTAPAMPDAEDLRDLRSLACSILDKYAADALTAPQQALPFDESLWQTLAESGLTLLSTPVSAGGSGAGIAEAAALLSAAAEYAAPGPIAESDLLAAWLLTAAQLDVPAGPLTSGTCEVAISEADEGMVRVAGTADRVPWARDCDAVVVLGTSAAGEVVIRLPADRCSIVPGHNVAHEPRDAVRFDLDLPRESVVPVRSGLAREWLLRGALARSAQTCGAMESCPGPDDRARVATHPVRSPARQVPGGAAPGRGGRRGSHGRTGRVRGGRADRRTGRDREPCW